MTSLFLVFFQIAVAYVRAGVGRREVREVPGRAESVVDDDELGFFNVDRHDLRTLPRIEDSMVLAVRKRTLAPS